jgi:hypothetical protein
VNLTSKRYLSSQEILECSALLKDIIHFGDIEESAASSTYSYENELYIRFSERVAAFKLTGGSSTTISTIYLTSPKRELILGSISSAKVNFSYFYLTVGEMACFSSGQCCTKVGTSSFGPE